MSDDPFTSRVPRAARNCAAARIAEAFIDALWANTGIVDMRQIFSAMRRQVVLNAPQTPQYSDIRQAGHEGGDFIFVRRK